MPVLLYLVYSDFLIMILLCMTNLNRQTKAVLFILHPHAHLLHSQKNQNQQCENASYGLRM